MNNRYHVVPVDDTRKHNTSTPACWCLPVVDELLVIHNAADGREFLEEPDEEEKRVIEAAMPQARSKQDAKYGYGVDTWGDLIHVTFDGTLRLATLRWDLDLPNPNIDTP